MLVQTENPILGGEHFHVRKNLVVEGGTIPSEEVSLPMDSFARKATQVDFHNLDDLLQPLEVVPISRERVVPTEWQVLSVLGDCIWKAKSDFDSSATVSAICADQRRPGSCKIEYKRRSNIGHELDHGPTQRDETSEPSVGHNYRPSITQLSKKMAADVQHALEKCESLGSGKQLILHGNPSAITGYYSPQMSVLRCHLLQNMQFERCMILQGTTEANVTSLLPAVNPLLGYSSEKPVQDQLA